MIANLQPYPEYKESGLPWLGRVPAHWSVRRIKTILRETDCRSADGSGTLLSLTRIRGLIPHKEMTDKMHSAKTLAGYKRYLPGQIVMNRMQAWSGMFGTGAIEGLVSPDYAVFDVLGGHEIKLVLERLKTPDQVRQFALESKGIGSGFNRLYTDRFGPIPISMPPTEEQAAMVRFLDFANGRLERTIRAKRKVITLLHEQKQAIIHRAVTRGLDPTAPLKPSGIPWLGDIPKHWEARRISSTCSLIVDGTHFSPKNDSTGAYLYITAKNIKEHGVEVSNATYVDAAAHREIYQRCPVRKGDVLYIKDGATAGLATVNNLEEEFSMLSSVALLRPRPEVAIPDFFALCLNDYMFKQHALSRVVGGAMTRFTVALLKRFPVRIPPLSEQARIVEIVNAELSPLRATQAKIEREIELLREYRTRLVADVVTGKLDVRPAARHLPAESAGPESAVTTEDLTDEAELEPNIAE